MARTWRGSGSGCWPDDRQRLLLRAATWGGERAVRAWEQWRALVSAEEVTWHDTRLLASAYRPLRRLGVDDPMLTLAGGAYRRTWYLNQLALRRAAQAVSALSAAGVEPLVLKGLALALLHYRDLGARPMDDVDLLVGPRHLQRSIDVLGRAGWQVPETQGVPGGPLRYGTHVVDENGNELDLHAYALMQSPDDADLLRSQVPLELPGVSTRALGPADQLVHVCLHGLRWDRTPTVRWAADAMAILANGDALDWEAVLERSQRWRMTVAVARALSWIREHLDAPVPAWVVLELARGPRLRLEGPLHRIWMQPATPLRFAIMSFDRYRRFAQLAPPDQRPTSFPAYLRGAWGLERPSQLLIHGTRKLASR